MSAELDSRAAHGNDIKAVFFDLYNTLAGFDPPREEVQARAANPYGLTLTKDGVDAGYHLADAFMARQNAAAPVRTMPSQEQRAFFARYEQLVLKGAGHEVDLEMAARIWAEVRRQQYSLALFPDVIPGLRAVRAALNRHPEGPSLHPEDSLGHSERSEGSGAGLRSPVIAVISNINYTGDELCKNLGLSGHVDFAITSRDAGADKPHPPIFLAALAKAGVSAAEAVLVGDQLDSDIGGALGVGMRPVLMDRSRKHPGYCEHPRVEGMAELPGILEKMRSG